MSGRKWRPADFLAWQEKHSSAIAQGQDQRREEIQSAVIGYVRRAIRDWRMTLNAAGDDLLNRFPYRIGESCSTTPPETRVALEAIGWLPARRRKKVPAE